MMKMNNINLYLLFMLKKETFLFKYFLKLNYLLIFRLIKEIRK